MQFSKAVLATMALAGSAVAQSNSSLCDKYTTALLMNNTADNQLTLLTLLVNTVVIGNYTKPNHNAVPGILAKGNVNGTDVNLLPYFNGGLASSNRGGDSGVSVNFLDDGGAVPLMMNMPANGTSSNQYYLLTHLYQFFGTLLGCSLQGTGNYSAYKGEPSMYNVHKFMDLTYAENTYFIQQVGLAAQSFGVTADDVQTVGSTLSKVFNYKCAPAITLAPALGSQLQSICIAADCPTAPNATCSAYAAAVEPGVANSSLAMGEGNSSSPATSVAANGGRPTSTGASGSAASGTAKPTSASGAGATLVGSGLLAGLAGLAALI